MSATPSTTSGHTSRAQDPSIVQESQKSIRLIGTIFGFVALVLVIWNIYSWVSTTTPPPLQSATTQQQYTKAIILRFDGFTPCDPPIDFGFELDTQGDPISLKFPGIEKPVEYSGKGTINAPEQRTSGSVHIASLDPAKQARVRIWEVITIQKR